MSVPDTRVSNRPPPQTRSRVGESFGQYMLVRRLGEGGMGEVYAGRHQRLGREVAIKVLREEFASNPEIIHRFFQEAKVVNELKHPNTVEIIDFVEEPRSSDSGGEPGRVYLVMELLVGRNLSELDREQGPLPLARIATIFAQACDALEAAHRLGVVHRDIKPDNLFVETVDGLDRVKVLDFGVARRLDGGGKTQVGMVLGTPAYMAPEQAAGREVDLRADVYALGVSLFEISSHSSAALGPTPAPLTRTAGGEPIPPRLTQLLQSMISLDPEQRPRGLTELKAVLEAIAAQPGREPSSTLQAMAAAGVGAGARPRRWPLAIAVLGPALLAGGWLLLHRDPPANVEPPHPVALPAVAEVTPPPIEPRIEPAPTLPATPRPRPAVRPKQPTERPSPPEPQPPRPTDPLEPYRDRIALVRRRFDGLVRRYGAEQLTTLEKAAVSEALAEAAGGDLTALDGSLTSAEHALADAERRLAR